MNLRRAFPARLQMVIGFSVLVALLVATLALGVGRLLRESIRESAVAGAQQTGRVFAELEVGPEEYRGGRLTPLARRELDAAVKTSSSLLTARIWSPDGTLVYHGGRPAGGRAPPGELEAALAGRTRSVATADGPARRLRTFVPIVLKGDRRPRNVLEMHLPYGPMQATIDRRTRRLALVLGVAALLFYAALLPTVLRGSRALADRRAARQLPLQRRLRRAMRDGELALVYQPKLDLRSGSIAGVEALLRWRKPGGDTIPPADFIPLAERTPVIKTLTMHVFELALCQSDRWAKEGIELDIAVNISACNLREPELAERLVATAAAHGRVPAQFTLEVTESAVSGSPESDLRTLAALSAAGFKLSIDDFGTGESSLSRINAVAFEEVKIDRSFMRELDQPGNPVLISRIIDLAQALGAHVVAEGVESDAAARRLAELGCDGMQGFQLARPLPPDELVEWLADFSGAESRAAACVSA